MRVQWAHQRLQTIERNSPAEKVRSRRPPIQPTQLPRRGRPLWFPVVVVVLRGDDDHHGEDGAQHDGCDADCQADEGEVARLAGGYLCRHHVAAGDCRAHLGEGRARRGEVGVCGIEQKLDRVLRNQEDARVGASPKTPLKNRSMSLRCKAPTPDPGMWKKRGRPPEQGRHAMATCAGRTSSSTACQLHSAQRPVSGPRGKNPFYPLCRQWRGYITQSVCVHVGRCDTGAETMGIMRF